MCGHKLDELKLVLKVQVFTLSVHCRYKIMNHLSVTYTVSFAQVAPISWTARVHSKKYHTSVHLDQVFDWVANESRHEIYNEVRIRQNGSSHLGFKPIHSVALHTANFKSIKHTNNVKKNTPMYIWSRVSIM